MEGLLTALQILTSLAVISLCVVVVDSVAKLRRFARKLGKTSTEAVENIAELTRMAREKELPHRADEALAEARRVMGELPDLTRRARESLANLDRLLADEAVKSAPGQIVDLVARGNDLVTQAQQAVDRLNAVLKAPADTAAMVTQSVRPMVEDAREKVDLLRSLFNALAA
jgi:alkanesulfonate monooxygenase SsuD/methylene tetrahydromethanopterin reductase-like flavin-dependent oxidoreductase (luciferase family)